MKILVNEEIRGLFAGISAVLAGGLALSQAAVWVLFREFSGWLCLIWLLAACCVLAVCFRYFFRQNEILEEADAQIHAYLAGDTGARIDCNKEGELYRLFHSVNTLAAVLNAHAENELSSHAFLKNTVSDISHQLKTPLAALSIYNGLLHDEAEGLPEVREFVELSEVELDRIETLVQNLLKIAKLDAGSVLLEKAEENVADLCRDVELHFAFRAKREKKQIRLSGADDIMLVCDRDWIMEALDNIVKNALDHTKEGDWIRIFWKQFGSVVQIAVKDNGSGIAPEDLHHIFKRFYRSRHSKDTQGIGLGLPLAKAIIEAHGGTVEVDSVEGAGATFTINFLIPTKL